MTHHSTQEWAVKNFGTALLFNKKKTQRLVRIATRLSEAKRKLALHVFLIVGMIPKQLIPFLNSLL